MKVSLAQTAVKIARSTLSAAKSETPAVTQAPAPSAEKFSEGYSVTLSPAAQAELNQSPEPNQAQSVESFDRAHLHRTNLSSSVSSGTSTATSSSETSSQGADLDYDVAEWRDKLLNDPQFEEYQTLREDNSYEAMVHLFENENLPGETAQERLDFILDVTSSSSKNPVHFNGVIPQDDSGFRSEVQDGHIWPGSSRQVGHFLTAVRMGYEEDRPFYYEAAAVGHELSADGTILNDALQTAQGFRHVGTFREGIQAVHDGDWEAMDQAVFSIMGEDNVQPGQWFRGGNSHEDLRLTMLGWAMGEMIQNGDLATREDVIAWMDEFIGEQE